ncbi:MAG: DNA mismatch repair endonuclease MutL [Clostridiaceae bacterium]|jgi:DNA mismatch repair protein MutL|nr:DNA mismatch repair endonuclease MutL [Clostridiaceae bacterium]
MGKIVILDENTANQIAAGEVIERPSSIVKEMVENALDANATSITVEISNGGKKYISITDNGDGIEVDDVELAFERHSTSKIRRIEDLGNLSTMGFRGEALASIASIAKVEVVTKTEAAVGGTRVIVEGGDIISVEPAGAPKGTTFIVRELFYNTPARYKFLKKDTTESSYVQDILTRISLARPDVSVKFISQGRTIMHTPGNHDLLSVIYSIYGKDIARAVIPVKASGEGLDITGFIGKPEIARGNRNYQSILVNNRFIYNRVITAAIEEAYKTRLMKKRFPFAVLKLNISPQFVDVNVHPSKLEVRFSDEQKVFRGVYHAVSGALSENASFRSIEEAIGKPSQKDSIFGTASNPQLNTSRKTSHQAVSPYFQPINRQETATQSTDNEINGEQRQSTSSPMHEKDKLHHSNGNRSGKDIPSPYELGKLSHAQVKASTAPVREQADDYAEEEQANTVAAQYQPSQRLTAKEAGNQTETDFSAEKDARYTQMENKQTSASREHERLLVARIIGQAFESYILLEESDDLLLIDQHAAHERIRYDKLIKQFAMQESFGQGLLSPLVVNLSELEMDKFHELSAYLVKLGFEAEDFGNRSILIRAIPYILDSSFSGQDFLEILEKLSQEVPSASEIIPEETLYMMACKSAIKANRKMTDMEIRGLIDELAKTENPYTCVHGRPIVISLSKRELEKRFKRIV